MDYLRRKLSIKMYKLYFLLSIYLVTGCKEEVQLNLISEPIQHVSSVSDGLPVTSAVSTVKLFDAELNKRKNLSSYAKTSNPFSAMVVNPSCIKVTNDPQFGSKRKVMLMNVRTHETGGVTGNPRAQVQTPMDYVEGQEVFIGFSVRFTKTFWTYFLTFSELYGAPYAGTAPFRLAIQENNIVASSYNGSKQVNLWKQPMKANVWYDFVYREVLSKDAKKGEVEVWLRKSGEKDFTIILSNTKMATITAANLKGPNYHKLACYYDKNHTYTDATRKTKVLLPG